MQCSSGGLSKGDHLNHLFLFNMDLCPIYLHGYTSIIFNGYMILKDENTFYPASLKSKKHLS